MRTEQLGKRLRVGDGTKGAEVGMGAMPYLLHRVMVVGLLVIQLGFMMAMDTRGWWEGRVGLYGLMGLLVLGHVGIYFMDLERMRIRLDRGERIRYFQFSQMDWFPMVASGMGAVMAYGIYHLDFIAAGMVASVVVFVFATLTKRLAGVWKNLDFAFYTGVFVGGAAIFQRQPVGVGWVLVSGVLAGFLFTVSKNSLIGVGGRLGTFAFIANLMILPWI